MNKFNKVIVALDLSENDDQVLNYLDYLVEPLEIKQLISAHVLPVLLVGGIVKFAAGEILLPVAPALDVIHSNIEKKTKNLVKSKALDINVRLVEGRPYKELLFLVEELKPDLLVMGKKKSMSGSGITAKRMARHITSDLLLIPEDSKSGVNRILVAVDFSTYSLRAIKRSISLTKKLGLKQAPMCLNVIDMPNYTEFSNREEIAQELPEIINGKFEKFLDEHNVDINDVDFHFTKTNNYNIAKTIKRYARAEGADLIMMGAKGHNILERFLLGSVAESMVDDYVNTPVYIIR
ncbi:MAG: universal stress protein [Saprospiraceae bacterium]